MPFEVILGAADGTRTRNNQLGRLGLYQLNYRRSAARMIMLCNMDEYKPYHRLISYPAINNGRGDRIRTCDILLPKQARYQAAPLPDAEKKYTARTQHLRKILSSKKGTSGSEEPDVPLTGLLLLIITCSAFCNASCSACDASCRLCAYHVRPAP